MPVKRVKTSLTLKGPRQNPFKVLRKEFETNGIKTARDLVYDEGVLLASTVQLYIFEQSGGPSWPDLNPQYLRYKLSQEMDRRKLIAHGDYVAAIKARKIAGGTKVEVGLPEDTHPGSGLSYKDLGRILEYGHRGFKRVGEGLIPPRAHWRPVWARWLKRVPRFTKLIQKQVSAQVFKRAEQKTGKKKVKA